MLAMFAAGGTARHYIFPHNACHLRMRKNKWRVHLRASGNFFEDFFIFSEWNFYFSVYILVVFSSIFPNLNKKKLGISLITLANRGNLAILHK